MSTMTMHYYFLPNEKFISYMPGAIYFEITHIWESCKNWYQGRFNICRYHILKIVRRDSYGIRWAPVEQSAKKVSQLKVMQRKSPFRQTSNILSIAKNFILSHFNWKLFKIPALQITIGLDDQKAAVNTQLAINKCVVWASQDSH